MTENLLISGGRIIDPSQGLDRIGDLLISQGKIQGLKEGERVEESWKIIGAQGLVVCPGFIDLHCHLREPGYEDKETIATGTKAAAKGGFTSLCCMPNTNPALDSRAIVELVIKKAANEGVVRVFPIGCITQGRKGKELAEMGELAAAGVVALSDDGSWVKDPGLLRHAMEYSLAFGLPIIEHCEDTALTEGGAMNEGWVSSLLGLRGMPAAAEEAAVARDLALAELTGARLHIAHISTASSVELVRQAKKKRLRVSAEVTPTHLTLGEERVLGSSWKPGSPVPEEAYDTNAKVNPPLRSRRDIAALLEGLKDGTIDAIATDHAPHTLVDKLCEFDKAAFGISVLETAFGSLMSLMHKGELDLNTLVSKLTLEPARLLGLPYGTLKVGAPADIVIFDPKAEWRVDPALFLSKGKNTPLAGEMLKGKVVATIVNGKIVYKDKALLLRGAEVFQAEVRG